MSILQRRLRLALPLAVLAALAGCHRPVPRATEGVAGGYLFCFWNTENFFDDKIDGEKREPDRTFDEWFGGDPAAFREKLDHLTAVLAPLNGGRGPDILALAEVENERAAELLMASLNRATRGAPPYRYAVYRDPKGGRHIATAVLTRLPVNTGRTRLLGKRLRMLEVHVEVNGHELVVLATHWTSRVTDTEGGGRARDAEQIYGRFRAMYQADPAVDLLVCGDFNDNPDDESVVKYLHATADAGRVRAGGPEPALLGLFSQRWQDSDYRRDTKYHSGKRGGKSRVAVVVPEKPAGTHYFRGRPNLFDQVVISPGLLDDQGWTCEVNTAEIVTHRFVTRRGQPLAFGTPRDKGERGASDHFPVAVRLKVAPP
jgi:endonuclease/exonuclease/phosphatase family metal-dependent hydrolase